MCCTWENFHLLGEEVRERGRAGENRVTGQNCSQEPQVQFKNSWEGKGRKAFVSRTGNMLAKHLVRGGNKFSPWLVPLGRRLGRTMAAAPTRWSLIPKSWALFCGSRTTQTVLHLWYGTLWYTVVQYASLLCDWLTTQRPLANTVLTPAVTDPQAKLLRNNTHLIWIGHN